MKEKSRSTFSGNIGFVLAAAGSAVGLGNIWRFPYLAAKDGGGLFLLVYLILVLTFGFALLTTEIAIGRKTGQGPLTAYGFINPKGKFIGVLACIVPAIILPYYCTIGGWVLKYFTLFITGSGKNAVADGYFTGFITGQWAPITLEIRRQVAIAAIGIITELVRKSKKSRNCIPMIFTQASGPYPSDDRLPSTIMIAPTTSVDFCLHHFSSS